MSTDETKDKYGQKERFIYYYGLLKIADRKQEKEMISDAIDTLLDEAKSLKDSEEWLAMVRSTIILTCLLTMSDCTTI